VQGDFPGEAEIDSWTNGILFREQTTGSLVEAIQAFEASEHLFSPENIARSARRFSAERFRREMTEFIASQMADFRSAARRQPLAASCRG
jgi:hypothetical protein